MSHSSACRRARTGYHHKAGRGDTTPDWPLMCHLSQDEQTAVLACPDPAHDSVRMWLRGKPLDPPPGIGLI